MTEFEEVCQQLDELVIQYFQKLEKLHDERSCLDNALKQGYFNLAKARYSMGNKAVGSLQYDSKSMKALATLSINESNSNSIELVRRNPQKKPTKKLTIVKNADTRPSETTVRRRKGQEKNTDDSIPISRIEELTISNEDNVKENEDNEVDVVSDPIKWFGILVPGALRNGQSDFIQAISQCCHIANLQKEVLILKEKYQTLHSRKKQLCMTETKQISTEH